MSSALSHDARPILSYGGCSSVACWTYLRKMTRQIYVHLPLPPMPFTSPVKSIDDGFDSFQETIRRVNKEDILMATSFK